MRLTSQLIDNQVASEENARNIIIEGIKERSETEQQAVQEAIDANELLNQSYQRQKALLDSKAALSKAQSQLTQTQSQIEIEELNRAIQIQQELASGKIENANVEKALKKELASLGVKGTNDELSLVKKRQKAERELFEEKQTQIAAELEQKAISLEIEAEQAKLQAERNILQAELNQLKAIEALQNAETEGNSRAIVLAQKQLDLSDKMLENARKQGETQDKILTRKQQQLEFEKQVAQTQEEADKKELTNKQNLERAKAGGTPSLSNKSSDINRNRNERPQRINFLGDRALSVNNQPLKQILTQALPKEILTYQITPNFGASGEGFSDKKMVSELQGVRQDIKSLTGVMANQSIEVNQNIQNVTRSGSNAGKMAISSVNL